MWQVKHLHTSGTQLCTQPTFWNWPFIAHIFETVDCSRQVDVDNQCRRGDAQPCSVVIIVFGTKITFQGL